MNLYADLDSPDFNPSFGHSGQKKQIPIKKNTNNNDKKIVKNNNNVKSNNKTNSNYTKNFGGNIGAINYNNNANKNKYHDTFENNDYNDNYNYVEDIISNPLSMFHSSKNKDDDNDDLNIKPGKQDIKSKIDIQKIESIIKSLNDGNHKYKSIKELQDILKELSLKYNLTTEESQSFLVYCWITKNISYYIGPRPDNTPLGALQKRITQCSGYSRLFKELLKIFKIKSVLVHGIGRTYNLDQRPKKENHEWNAIKINNEYYLCEVTWGAGKVENNKFVKEYNTFYFCCPPDVFIYTHFPSKDLSKWMLLDKIITQDQFENILYKDKYFYYYGFNEIQPKEGIVQLKKENNIEIKFENINQIKSLRLSCKIFYENKLIENISYIEKYVTYFLIHLIFNKKGKYNVLYFATDKSGTVHSNLIARQQFYVMTDAKEIKTFPTIFTFPDELYIREPKYNYLPRNKEILFSFSSNEIDDMGIVIDKKCIHLKKNYDTFMGKFIVVGEEILVGKFDSDNPGNLKVMIKYKVRK